MISKIKSYYEVNLLHPEQKSNKQTNVIRITFYDKEEFESWLPYMLRFEAMLLSESYKLAEKKLQ